MARPFDGLLAGIPDGDVAAIVGRIREAVAAEREAGVVTPEDFERMATERLHSLVRSIDIDPKLRRELLSGGRAWNIDTGYVIRSHRAGPIVWVLLVAKRFVRPFVKLYTDHILKRQTQLNLCFFEMLHNAAMDHVRMDLEIKNLRARLPPPVDER